MKTKNLDSPLNQTNKPRCRICGFLLSEPLKENEECPNCSANAKIVAGYYERESQD
jgi:rubrerythrin